ncbi:MAG TPA: caspase family protein [Candidatus Ozemobacteraceae bacterium]|nr:caspase family protein [Candidatus Ozemobacteraceae bacterium]
MIPRQNALRISSFCRFFLLVGVLVGLCLTHTLNAETRRISTDVNLPGAQPLGSGRKVALLIGNEAYGELGALSNPVNDVNAFSKALESCGFGVMTRTNCTRKEMSKAVQEFADQCRGSDVALFYYSGHGSQLKGENYLWPIQADAKSEADLEDECFRAQRLIDMMTEANARINIVILDACRNVPFKSGSRSSTRGLAQMNSSSGQFLIAFATDPGAVAQDGVAGTNSPYMLSILNTLKKSGLSLSEFFMEVRKDVKRLTNGQQRPWETACLEDRFYFNNPIPPTPEPVTTVPPAPEPVPGSSLTPTPVATPQAVPTSDTGASSASTSGAFLQFVQEYGASDTGPGEFLGVVDMAITRDDDLVLLTNAAQPLQIRSSSDLSLVRSFGAIGKTGFSLQTPRAVAAGTKTGNIAVCDIDSNRVVVFNREGVPVLRFVDQVNRPVDLAFDDQENLYVIMEGQPGIFKYSPFGIFMQTLSANLLPRPTRLSFAHGHLIAVDDENRKLLLYTPAGKLEGEIDLTGSLQGVRDLAAVDLNGHLYLTADNDTLILADAKGKRISQVKASEVHAPKFSAWNSMAITADQSIFTVDRQRGILLRFSRDAATE